jgi:hypothetical protein
LHSPFASAATQTCLRPDGRTFGHRFGHGRLCRRSQHAAGSAQPCRHGSRCSWYQTRITPGSPSGPSISRNGHRNPSASPCRSPHARPADHRAAFRRFSTEASTTRACAMLSPDLSACGSRGGSTRRHGLRATFSRLTSISYALDKMAWTFTIVLAARPAASISA